MWRAGTSAHAMLSAASARALSAAVGLVVPRVSTCAYDGTSHRSACRILCEWCRDSSDPFAEHPFNLERYMWLAGFSAQAARATARANVLSAAAGEVEYRASSCACDGTAHFSQSRCEAAVQITVA